MALGHWSEIINKNLKQKNLDDSCVFLGLSTFQTRVTQNPFRIKIKQSNGMQKKRKKKELANRAAALKETKKKTPTNASSLQERT